METELLESVVQVDEDLDEKYPEKVFKSNIRNLINASAGDTESLLGTTADATQFLLYGFTSLIVKLYSASSTVEVQEAAAPFVELSSGFLAKVESGEVKLPFMAKGVESVFSEIEQRATAVAGVLESVTEDGE
jgi:hypothetical protein